ncbi:hypothetical protein [Gandjariella thermophila]|uniref:hypothetical protein n=1 Tax=Gandjariella thermophila TaxID=1931992 RepID=UPI0010F92D72|nr:hypothetical protein [Gandjariella thermophila]
MTVSSRGSRDDAGACQRAGDRPRRSGRPGAGAEDAARVRVAHPGGAVAVARELVEKEAE